METQTQRLMPAKAVKSETMGEYRYEFADGFTVAMWRLTSHPEQIHIVVRDARFNTISEMLVWAREAKKE